MRRILYFVICQLLLTMISRLSSTPSIPIDGGLNLTASARDLGATEQHTPMKKPNMGVGELKIWVKKICRHITLKPQLKTEFILHSYVFKKSSLFLLRDVYAFYILLLALPFI